MGFFNPRAKTAHAYHKLIREVFLPSEESVEGSDTTYTVP